MYKISMLKIYQQTISKPITLTGVGLHSGLESKIVIKPGKEDQGIVFIRNDLKNNNIVKADYRNVSNAKLCTTLQNEHGVKVSTVEHLLAAMYIYGIDNAVIEINAEEVPIMDGSAKNFLEELENSEIKVLNKKRKYLKIIKKITLEENGKNISIEPNNFTFEVNFKLNYDNKLIGKQENTINFTKENLQEVFTARTFCLYEDIEKIKKIGLAKGGSLNNAVVVDKDKVLNKEGLRCDKEFVNHKILDLAGDFMLSGYRVLGKVSCYQGGHELTNTFLRKFLKLSDKYTISEINDVLLTNKSDKTFHQKIAISA